MRRYAILFPTAFMWMTLSCAELEARKAADVQTSVEVDAETRAVLQKINSVSAYEVPDLELQQDDIYAKTAKDVEPFGHVKPFKEHFLLQMEYTGPGRAIPEPADVNSVKIGFIGPIMSTVSVATGGKSHEEPLGIKMLQGARLAIEQANANGGYLKRNLPFELVISNDNGLWGASGNEIIKMAYKDKVWAILGTIDGANSHIAIRVALKAEIVIMNSGDTDPTFIETNIPWVFRCIGDDRQQSYLLVDYLYRKLGLQRVGIIRASNRYGRFGVREINDGSRRLGNPIVLEMAYSLGIDDFFQVNNLLNHRWVQLIEENLEPEPEDRLIDLFCGSGLIALSIAGSVRTITGIEGNGRAARYARFNAQRNGIDNVTFFTRDLTHKGALKHMAPSGEGPLKVVADPPRTGIAGHIIESIAALSPVIVVYVSCNSATLARDLCIFSRMGYRTERMTVIDMFPRTHHIEAVARLRFTGAGA